MLPLQRTECRYIYTCRYDGKSPLQYNTVLPENLFWQTALRSPYRHDHECCFGGKPINWSKRALPCSLVSSTCCSWVFFPLLKPSRAVDHGPPLTSENDTGLPAYSDSVGTAKKCHCKRGASYCVTVSEHFYCMKVQLGVQKSVTVTGELLTVSL